MNKLPNYQMSKTKFSTLHIEDISPSPPPYSRRRHKQLGGGEQNLPEYIFTCPNMTYIT